MTATDFKELRRRLFKSQQQAADALGVDQTTISRWETGSQPVPRMAELALERLNSNRRKKKVDVGRGL